MRGDDTRAWGPPFAPYKDGRGGEGESAYYLSVSVALSGLWRELHAYHASQR